MASISNGSSRSSHDDRSGPAGFRRRTAWTQSTPSIVETIGGTPLVALPRLDPERTSSSRRVMLKLEFFNPLGSVKDRIGAAMLLDCRTRLASSVPAAPSWSSRPRAIPASRWPSSPPRGATG